MIDERSIVVVGGGFQGLIACQLLAEARRPVILVERSDVLGGVLASAEQDGLFLDNGCHVFENSDSETTHLVRNVLEPDILPVEVRYASVTEGRKVDGISIPDFSGADPVRRDRMVVETISAVAASADVGVTLSEQLRSQYGPALADALAAVVRKAALAEPEELDGSAFYTLPLRRVRLLPDEPSMLLKQLPGLDERLAVPSQSTPMRFYPEAEATFPHRIFYPRGKGMRTFCQRSESYLRARNVTLFQGSAIEALSRDESGRGLVLRLQGGQNICADRLVWTLEPHRLVELACDDASLAGQTHQVPLALYYFLVPAEAKPGYTYVQDFSPETMIYRASSPGFYGKQRNSEGLTYLLAEVPTDRNSARWREPDTDTDRVWQEMRALGMTELERPVRTIIRQTPVSHRLYRPGYRAAAKAALAQIEADWPDIMTLDGLAFSKVDMIETIRDRLGNLLG